MDIAAALKVVESRIHSGGDSAEEASLEGAFSALVGAAMGGSRDRGTVSSSSSSVGCLEAKAEAEAEAEYALNVILSLTKASDPRFQSYFSCLRSLGVSVEDAHKRVHANRSAAAFKHELFASSPSNAALPPGGGGFLDKRLRVCIEEKHWPHVLNLLFQSVLRDPTRAVEIVKNDLLESSKDTFLEVRKDQGRLSMKLYLGAESVGDPAFVVSMKVSMHVLSLVTSDDGSESAVMRQLTMATVSRGALHEACLAGALTALIPSRFAVSSLLCMPLTSLDNLLAWLDLLHSCELPPNPSTTGTGTGLDADSDSILRMLVLSTGSAVYSLSLLLVWALLGSRKASAPVVSEERQERVCSLLSWLCGDNPTSDQGRRGAAAVSQYRYLFHMASDEDGEERAVAGKSKKKKADERGTRDGDDAASPPLGASVLTCIAASALDLLAPSSDEDGQEESKSKGKKRGRSAESSRWQLVVAAAEPTQVRCVAEQMCSLLDRPDSPLGVIVAAMLDCADSATATKEASARVSKWAAQL